MDNLHVGARQKGKIFDANAVTYHGGRQLKNIVRLASFPGPTAWAWERDCGAWE